MVCFDANSYNYKTFDNLPSLDEARKAFSKFGGLQTLQILGKVFCTFNIQKKFGLILLHRHFEMTPMEFTFEVLSETKTISMPWNLLTAPTPVSQEFLEKNGVRLGGNVVQPFLEFRQYWVS